MQVIAMEDDTIDLEDWFAAQHRFARSMGMRFVARSMGMRFVVRCGCLVFEVVQ